jgi:hypothetical protein
MRLSLGGAFQRVQGGQGEDEGSYRQTYRAQYRADLLPRHRRLLSGNDLSSQAGGAIAPPVELLHLEWYGASRMGNNDRMLTVR